MCANPLHEDARGLETCNGTCDGSDEEDVTVETVALDVPAISEAEHVRRMFRDELLDLLGRAHRGPGTQRERQAYVAGRLDGGIEGILMRRCGVSPAVVRAARAGR